MSDWQEFSWGRADAEPGGPLCVEAGPSGGLDCAVEGADLTTEVAEAAAELVVCAYNVERGLRLHDQLEAFRADDDIPRPDVLLISEADRGCSRSAEANVAREYARALGMYYVYAVEFVELPRLWGPGGGAVRRRCEHGNAIISRFPLGNVRAIRHRRSRSWNSRLQRAVGIGQPRLGGRIAVAADARVGDSLLRLYSVHFESGRRGRGHSNRDQIRRSQALEVAADASGVPHPVLIGGDMNVAGYLGTLSGVRSEPATSLLFEDGFVDAHMSLDPQQRISSDSGIVIDLVVGRGVTFVDAGVGSASRWGDLSDHLPIWTRVALA